MTTHKSLPPDEVPGVCVLHLDLAELMTGIRTDVKWILRIGWSVLSIAGATVLAIIGIIMPYFSSVNASLALLRSDIAVNAQQLAACNENWKRSADDRRDLHQAIQSLQMRDGVKMEPDRKK